MAGPTRITLKGVQALKDAAEQLERILTVDRVEEIVEGYRAIPLPNSTLQPNVERLIGAWEALGLAPALPSDTAALVAELRHIPIVLGRDPSYYGNIRAAQEKMNEAATALEQQQAEIEQWLRLAKQKQERCNDLSQSLQQAHDDAHKKWRMFKGAEARSERAEAALREILNHINSFDDAVSSSPEVRAIAEAALKGES